MTFSASVEEADVLFNDYSDEGKPMGRYDNRLVFVHREDLDKVQFNTKYHCRIDWNGKYGFAKIFGAVESSDMTENMDSEQNKTEIQPDSLYEDIVYFNRRIQNRAGGFYRGYPVKVDDRFIKDVKIGDSFLCRLYISEKDRCYTAVPEKKITIEEILDMDPAYLDQIVQAFYEKNPSCFDQLITGMLLKRERQTIETEFKDQMGFLEKENARLEDLLKNTNRIVPAAIPQPSVSGSFEYIEDNMFFSDKLEDRYYSLRVNIGKSRVMLVKDDEGEINASGNAVPLESIRKILGSEKIKREFGTSF